MPRALWSAAAFFLIAHGVPAAQGTHPGPLPSPIGPDSTTGAPTAAEPPRYPETRTFGTSRAPAPPGDLRDGRGARPDWSGGQGPTGYPPTVPGRSYVPGDYGYGPPPRPGGGSGQPRGYWKWVPAEPAEPEGYGYGPGAWPGSGYDDDYSPYAPYGYASPYEGYGDGYRDAYPGGGFGPPGYGGYGGYGPAYPGSGTSSLHEADGYYPSFGPYPEPPGGPSDGGPRLPMPAPSELPRGSSSATR